MIPVPGMNHGTRAYLTEAEVEARFPEALSVFDMDTPVLREGVRFYVYDGHLRAVTPDGWTYSWSVEDQEWFDVYF